jgi:hypothetical protein
MNPDLPVAKPGCANPGLLNPGVGAGVLGVSVRSIGAAVMGAVRVVGGAEFVMLPRLPMELPPPKRASDTAGASNMLATAMAANRREPRPVMFLTLYC